MCEDSQFFFPDVWVNGWGRGRLCGVGARGPTPLPLLCKKERRDVS